MSAVSALQSSVAKIVELSENSLQTLLYKVFYHLVLISHWSRGGLLVLSGFRWKQENRARLLEGRDASYDDGFAADARALRKQSEYLFPIETN